MYAQQVRNRACDADTELAWTHATPLQLTCKRVLQCAAGSVSDKALIAGEQDHQNPPYSATPAPSCIHIYRVKLGVNNNNHNVAEPNRGLQN